VSAVNGQTAAVGHVITLPSGALLTLDADGSYDYNPNGAFQSLGAGVVGSDSFTYQVSDGNGGFATATVHLSVTGQNDGPVIVDPAHPGQPPADPNHVIAIQAGADGQPITPLNIASAFGDPDAGDHLTLSVNPAALPPGITFDPATGTFAGTPGPAASVGGLGGKGLYAVTVTATDASGATVTTVITFDFRNVAPVAVNDTAHGRANSTTTFDVLGNDHDGGNDRDTLTVTSAKSANGTVVINADGTLSFTPAPGFAGTATIDYMISDGQGGFATAYVTFDVQPSSHDEAPVPGAPSPIAAGGAAAAAAPTTAAPAADQQAFGGVPGIAAEGIVVGTVNSAGQLGGMSGSLGTNGIIDKVANQISGLGGVNGTGNGGRISGTGTLPVSSQPWSLENSADGPIGAGRSSGTFDPQGLTGFSLKFAADAIADAKSPQIVLNSLIHDRTLTLSLTSPDVKGHAKVVEFRVMQADGRPLPSWLHRNGNVLQGQRPANAEVLTLKMIGILSDGTVVERAVTVQTNSGEVQPFSEDRRVEAPSFSDQLKTFADAGLSADPSTGDAGFDRLQLALAG
jgi:VCBS repeat-containing protein